MSITRKWAFARAEYIDPDTSVAWIAESRAGTGTWVIRECDGEDGRDDLIRGIMVPFDDSREGTLLAISSEDREGLGMSEATLHVLEVELRLDQQARSKDARAFVQGTPQVRRPDNIDIRARLLGEPVMSGLRSIIAEAAAAGIRVRSARITTHQMVELAREGGRILQRVVDPQADEGAETITAVEIHGVRVWCKGRVEW